MKALVAYYSRTGTVGAVAEEVAAALGADIEAIRPECDFRGVLGFMLGGKQAMLRQTPALNPPENIPGDYDLVVVGTPVWANSMASPVRSWLMQHAAAIRSAAFFCVTASSGREQTLSAMAELVGLTPLATMGLLQKQVRRGLCHEQVRDFAGKINAD